MPVKICFVSVCTLGTSYLIIYLKCDHLRFSELGQIQEHVGGKAKWGTSTGQEFLLECFPLVFKDDVSNHETDCFSDSN